MSSPPSAPGAAPTAPPTMPMMQGRKDPKKMRKFRRDTSGIWMQRVVGRPSEATRRSSPSPPSTSWLAHASRERAAAARAALRLLRIAEATMPTARIDTTTASEAAAWIFTTSMSAIFPPTNMRTKASEGLR